MSRSRLTAWALLLGLCVTALVTATAGSKAGLCTPHPDGACDALVRTLSLRMGIVAGVATVLALLMVAGLLRMVALDEERRSRLDGSD